MPPTPCGALNTQLDTALKQLSQLKVDVMSLKSQVAAAEQRAEKASQADTEFLATLRSKVRVRCFRVRHRATVAWVTSALWTIGGACV